MSSTRIFDALLSELPLPEIPSMIIHVPDVEVRLPEPIYEKIEDGWVCQCWRKIGDHSYICQRIFRNSSTGEETREPDLD